MISLAQVARFSSLTTKIFVAGDENLLCAGNTYKRFLSLTTIFNIKYVRNSFSSLISVARDKNRAVSARLELHRPTPQVLAADYQVRVKNCDFPCAQQFHELLA